VVGCKADKLLRNKNIATKSKEAMAGLSEIERLMRRIKDLRIGSWNVLRKMPERWEREVGGMSQGIRTAGRSF
jgi:hypothetical protein